MDCSRFKLRVTGTAKLDEMICNTAIDRSTFAFVLCSISSSIALRCSATTCLFVHVRSNSEESVTESVAVGFVGRVVFALLMRFPEFPGFVSIVKGH